MTTILFRLQTTIILYLHCGMLISYVVLWSVFNVVSLMYWSLISIYLLSCPLCTVPHPFFFSFNFLLYLVGCVHCTKSLLECCTKALKNLFQSIVYLRVLRMKMKNILIVNLLSVDVLFSLSWINIWHAFKKFAAESEMKSEALVFSWRRVKRTISSEGRDLAPGEGVSWYLVYKWWKKRAEAWQTLVHQQQCP